VIRFLWPYLGRPLLSWLIVSLVILGLDKLYQARKLAALSAERAMALPVGAKMAEVTFQVTRANGTVEPAQTYRTYKNPLRRWAWAIKTAFTSKGA
jgi:hypothetical protein